tara:strand:- start:593 stop:922 length:330 start_codon:yes stop_codon:yes gene_type:complete
LKKKIFFFILLLTTHFASAAVLPSFNITTFNIATQEQKSVFYNNGNLHITGFKGQGLVEIYSIIGNKITDLRVQQLDGFQIQYPLKKGNMYIIRIQTKVDIITFKVVAL